MVKSDLALWELVRAIVAGDAACVSRLLAASPPLASACFHTGATRQMAKTYYLDQIERFTDIERLADTVAKVAGDQLEKVALEKLRVAIQNKKEGKPHKPIYVLSRDESGQLLSDASDSVL